MQSTTIRMGTAPSASKAQASELGTIKSLIARATHFLPTQGPITVFVHHNPLHAFENEPFVQAVEQAAELYDREPWWSESRYREELQRGRIGLDDLQHVLMEESNHDADLLVGGFGTRFALRLAMLQFPLQSAPDVELRWLLAETDVLRRFHPGVAADVRSWMITRTRTWLESLLVGYVAASNRRQHSLIEELHQGGWLTRDLKLHRAGDEALTLDVLWHVVENGVRQAAEWQNDVVGCDVAEPRPTHTMARPLRPRDVVYAETGVDPDTLVHEVLIRFCAAYLDQGSANESLPFRDEGFARCFARLYQDRTWTLPDWMGGLGSELASMAQSELATLHLISNSLALANIEVVDHDEFILQSLLALPGWAGMIWQLETNAPWTPHPAPPGSLQEFLAVRLVLDRYAAHYVARQARRMRHGTSPDRDEMNEQTSLRHTFTVFQMAQVRGWLPQQLWEMTPAQWQSLVHEIVSFSEIRRRRILHLAYEHRFCHLALDALAAHVDSLNVGADHPAPTSPASWHLITCIDDREESFRRHVEEVDATCTTFGAAGFFAVAMYYRSMEHATFRPLCPINVVPQHFVQEAPLFSLRIAGQRWTERRRIVGQISRVIQVASRTLVGGVVTGIMGSLATLPMIGRVLAPGLTDRLRRAAHELVPRLCTELQLLHTEESGHESTPSMLGLQGFTYVQMASIVIRLLEDIGLRDDFAPIVLLLGHGSSSLNNPHESAYQCGACSGSPGGPNARAFAWMANQPQVREQVRRAGIYIPETTHFVGGQHDTCTDQISYFDLDSLPWSQRNRFLAIQQVIQQACARNAHERSRRFSTELADDSPDLALELVARRAADLSQVRPEYNHATTAICLVGRRYWSRGLFLDRRAFLVSYDPDQDAPDRPILARILAAVVPVCAGISLEYLFSAIDPEGFGCGSKLPHNIVSLTGVMSGASSDLRPGLSQQMIEIHEPMRLRIITEADIAALDAIVADNPTVRRLVVNEWVQLASIDPGSGRIFELHRGTWKVHPTPAIKLATASTSREWYGGKRDHLEFARIVPSASPVATWSVYHGVPK